MTDHHLTIFIPDQDRLSTKLRADHHEPVDTSGGPRDPRTRRKLDVLSRRASIVRLCTDRDAFLLLVGQTIARELPDHPLHEPALTLFNLTVVEQALHLGEQWLQKEGCS